MQETYNAGLADKAVELNRIAGEMVNICETALRDAIDAVSMEWKCDAQRLFKSRMEELREEALKNSNNLLRQSSNDN